MATITIPQQETHYDFRSDTVTVPSPEMIQAMVQAAVGDDVRGEDATVLKLEEKVAALGKKDKGLFVCSGVMSNQLAVRSHITQLAGEREVPFIHVICDIRSHLYSHELGGIAFHSGTQALPINPLHFGSEHLTAEIIEKHLYFGSDLHTPITALILLENTLGGQIFPLEEIKKIKTLCDKHKIRLHVDGARMWNACVETGITLEEYCSYFDSISLCFSKGLGAPIGSVLLGDSKVIALAKQYRKSFGGGWRQAGMLAAASIYALDYNWKRLKEDHENAKYFYKQAISLGFEAKEPHTNIIFIYSKSLGLNFNDILNEINKIQSSIPKAEKRVLLEADQFECRVVFHLQTPREGVERLVVLLKEALKNLSH